MKKYKLLLSLIVFFTLGDLKSQSSKSRKVFSIEEIMQSWIGYSKSSIIREWGPPTEGTVSDGNDGTILKYHYYNSVSYPPVFVREYIHGSAYTFNIRPSFTKYITKYYYVYCNKNGEIYYIKWGTF